MADNVDEHSGMFKNSSDSRFLHIDHEEIQHMHLFNSASFDTNNDKNNVNEARNENVDNLRQVDGSSVNQPSDKKIPDIYQIFIATPVADAKFIAYSSSICAKYEQ